MSPRSARTAGRVRTREATTGRTSSTSARKSRSTPPWPRYSTVPTTRSGVSPLRRRHCGKCSRSSAASTDRNELVHDFTDSAESTRFLGDLYQNISASAGKRYALLQTPDFVVDFFLDRTMNPPLEEFGLKDFSIIDPACGRGHFRIAHSSGCSTGGPLRSLPRPGSLGRTCVSVGVRR